MAEENKNTETLENTGGQENNTAENSAKEKKYSETDNDSLTAYRQTALKKRG